MKNAGTLSGIRAGAARSHTACSIADTVACSVLATVRTFDGIAPPLFVRKDLAPILCCDGRRPNCSCRALPSLHRCACIPSARDG